MATLSQTRAYFQDHTNELVHGITLAAGISLSRAYRHKHKHKHAGTSTEHSTWYAGQPGQGYEDEDLCPRSVEIEQHSDGNTVGFHGSNTTQSSSSEWGATGTTSLTKPVSSQG
ncbi:hypothetical protein THAR02_03978 [Trichoderma harzianum]|uniref:Uncharacterized protein n=1 Tax=Trichoderma harzianum TaxID=5544 RepID=A0A0F9XFS6_TRIHA|nr:hypothetical protein THAR02_03978 [Trichoderma harzianum]